MAYFEDIIIPNYYGTIDFNGTPLTSRTILNFAGTAITVVDNAGSVRTDFTSTALSTTGGTMTGNLILNADPTVNLQAVTKQYVDSLSGGLSPKTSARAGTTVALTATYSNGASGVGATLTNSSTQAAFALDGVSLAANDRVLIKDQAAQAQNGIYTVTTVGDASHNWVLTRATDYNTSALVAEGSYLIIEEGTVNATNMFVETGAGPFTIGTTAIIFSAFNSAANISVSAPLSKSGNTISLTTPLTGTYGGTGVNNGASLLTLAGNFTTSGANPLTLITTGSTTVTFPTSGTLVNSAVATLSSLTSVGTIGTGVWQGTLVAGTYGGTGVNNGASTITIAGNISTAAAHTLSGAFASTFIFTNTTSVTFPTSGTLVNSAVATLSSLTSVGTIGTGVWQGTLVAGTYGGTGVNNGAKTFTYLKNISFTAADDTGVYTLPTGTKTLIDTTVTTLSSLTSVGTIGTGVWQGSIIAGAYGGTNNGFLQFSGPASTLKTYTGPNASCNILTDNAAVTVAQGGTGNASATAYAVQCGGTTSTGVHQSIASVGTSGQVLTSNGAGALPTMQTYGGATGMTLQTLSTSLTTTFSTASTTMTDLTGLTQALTPAASSSTVLVTVNIAYSASTTGTTATFNLLRAGTPIGQGTSVGSRTAVSFAADVNNPPSAPGLYYSVSYQFLDSPATSSSTTYKIQCATTAGTLYINRDGTDTNSAAFFRPISTITVQEIHG